jgi:transcriptional regulator
MRAEPFAHFLTAHSGLRSTRIPLLVDCDQGKPARLRAHLNAQNPQAQGLDGQEALVTFDGPWAYVSPHWRTDLSRAATFDYEAVQVRGVVRVMSDIAFFRRQVDDLAALIEPQHADLGDYPIWNSAMTSPGYVERLFPAIVAFEIDIHAVQMISKLHQTFPEADRVRIADYLDRSHRAARARLAKKCGRGPRKRSERYALLHTGNGASVRADQGGRGARRASATCVCHARTGE